MPSTREITNGLAIDFHEDGEPPYATFEVTYIDAMSWGLLATVTVKTNITVANAFPGGVLMMDRLNLMRSRDLNEMARRIDVLIPPPKSAGRMDWQHHLEHVAVMVNAEQVKPVPAIDLEAMPRAERQKWVMPGLLAKDKSNVLYGPGGVGKSVLALRMAASVVTGAEFCEVPVYEPGNVLYLDWEDDAETMVERRHFVADGIGISNFPLKYKSFRGRGPYERHHADVKADVMKNDIRLVIFDSTAMAMHGGSQGDGADGAIKFFQLISQLETTTLLIDHLASEDVKGEKGSPKPYGSVFKVNSARNMWEASPWERGGAGITLRHRKSNVGAKQQAMEVAVSWGYDVVTFNREA